MTRKMKKAVLIALNCYLGLVFLCAQEGGPRRLENPEDFDLPGGARVEFHQFQAPSLGTSARFSVFLPPDYLKDSSARLPVVYFLHGLWNDHTSWVVERYGGIPAQLETLMKSGKIPPALIVFPDGGNSFYTDYLDGSRRYEQLIVHDLPAHIEGHFRVIPESKFRALGGVSMGGFGALKIGLKHPDRYAAVAGVSPIVLLGDDPSSYLRGATNRLAQYLVTALEPVFGIPFDPAHWRKNNVEHLAASSTPGTMRLYIGYGSADRYNAYFPLEHSLLKISETLRERGFDHSLVRYENGPHGWQLVVDHLEEIATFLTQTFRK